MRESNYVYQSRQDSILRPFYQRWLWNFILSVLPHSLAPNTMTAIATIACLASFLLAATMNDSAVAMVVAALLILVYLTLDNLDGAHARKIGRSSHLGEFLDHWLDTLNNGFVILGACLAAGLPPLLALAVLSCGTLAFFSVQWELRWTGVFRMGRVADIEGNTTVALLYLTIAVLGPGVFQTVLAPGLPSLAVLLGCGVMLQALWTVVSAIRQVSEARADFLPILLAHLVVLTWAGTGAIDPRIALAIAFFLNPVFTSRPVCGRLLGRNVAMIDWAVVVTLLLLTFPSAVGVSPPPANSLGILGAAGLAGITAWYFTISVRGLDSLPVLAVSGQNRESGVDESLRTHG